MIPQLQKIFENSIWIPERQELFAGPRPPYLTYSYHIVPVVVTCFPPSQCSDGCGQPTAHNELGQTRAVHTALEYNAISLTLVDKVRVTGWNVSFGEACGRPHN